MARLFRPFSGGKRRACAQGRPIRVGYQTSLYTRLSRLDTLEVCLEESADLLEIFLDQERAEEVSTKEARKLARLARSKGVALQLHAPFRPEDLGKPLLHSTLGLARDLSADVVTVHLSNLTATTEKPNWRLALDSGIEIGIENDPGSDPKALIAYLKSCPAHAPVGVTLDVGHANLRGSNALTYAEQLLVELESIRRPIVNVHLHDNEGDQDNHLDLGDGNIEFERLLPILRDRGRCGRFVIERWDGRQANLARTRDWLGSDSTK